MPDASNSDSFRPRPPITDSPWFWVELFSLAALVGVVVIGPKYQVREAKLETRAIARQEALQRIQRDGPPEIAEELPGRPPVDPRETPLVIPLWPLIGLLLAIFIAARYARRRAMKSFLLSTGESRRD